MWFGKSYGNQKSANRQWGETIQLDQSSVTNAQSKQNLNSTSQRGKADSIMAIRCANHFVHKSPVWPSTHNIN